MLLPDVKANYTLSQSDFNQMVSGERICIERNTTPKDPIVVQVDEVD